MDPEWIAEIRVAQGGPGSSAQASDPYGSEADSYGCRGGILDGMYHPRGGQYAVNSAGVGRRGGDGEGVASLCL